MPKKQPDAGHEPIESRLEKLEDILEKLGEGEATLDESSNLYQQGMELVNDCRKELKEARGRVEKLNRETGELEPLDREQVG